MQEASILIGELSRQTGCNIETIRYYERIGVIPKAARKGRYRCYRRTDVARLSFARRARELGFSLDNVRALLGLSEGGHTACTRVRDIAAENLKIVRARIDDLQRMETVLTKAVRACGKRGKVNCPLIETLSNAP